MSGRRTGAFDDFDFDGFWDDHAFSANYNESAPSDALIAEIEAELGFTLPDAYVELARLRNGGGVDRTCYAVDEPTGWAEDHIAITGIYAIGRTARYSLLGELGARHMREEWGYPDWGVGVADTPTAGHEQIMLDYRECGPRGEPRVVYVDQESDYAVTIVAPDFATFIRGLVNEDQFDDSEEMAEEAFATVRNGTLSPVLRRALDAAAAELPDGEALIRAVAERIVRALGGFFLRNDGNSWQLYDTMFWLYSHLATASSFEDFFARAEGQLDYERPCFQLMVTTSFVAHPYGFQTTAFAEGFLREWWDAKLGAGAIVAANGGYRFTEEYVAAFLRVLRASRDAS